jgi:hypothetical protein
VGDLVVALAASVVMYLDPPGLTVYVDARPAAATDPTALVTEAACPYLTSNGVPTPVPYTLRLLKKASEGERWVPDGVPLATGLVSKCPASRNPRVRAEPAGETIPRDDDVRTAYP